MEVLVRSGIVDGLYTVVLEIVTVNLLLRVVKGITRLLGIRRANKHGHLRVISTRWTNVLGRGTSASGHILRLFLLAIMSVSISLITYGTTGFTKIETTEKEVVYVTQTDNVDAQFKLAMAAAQRRTINWAFASSIYSCTRRDADGLNVYSAFCDSARCMEGLKNDGVQREDDDREFLDHIAENGRCNDGLDAPEIEISTDFQIESESRRLPLIEFRAGDSFTLPWEELDVSDRFRLYSAVREEPETESGNAQFAFSVKAFYEDKTVQSFTILEILEEDLIRVSTPIKAEVSTWPPEGETWDTLKEKPYLFWENLDGFSVFLLEDEGSADGWSFATYEGFTLRVKNSNVLVSDIRKWIQTSTLLAITDDFSDRTWQALTMVNLRVVSGVLETEFVEMPATRISALSIAGFITLVTTALVLLLTLTTCTVMGRIRAYEAVNLALSDNEIYGLLKNQHELLGDASHAKSNHLELGFSSKCEQWGVLGDEEI